MQILQNADKLKAILMMSSLSIHGERMCVCGGGGEGGWIEKIADKAMLGMLYRQHHDNHFSHLLIELCDIIKYWKIRTKTADLE